MPYISRGIGMVNLCDFIYSNTFQVGFLQYPNYACKIDQSDRFQTSVNTSNYNSSILSTSQVGIPSK